MCVIVTSLKWVYLSINTFRICYLLVLLIHSFQKIPIYVIITQEIGVTSIWLEKKRKKFADKTIRTTGLTTWNSIDDKIQKAISTNYLCKSFKSLLIINNSCLCISILICSFLIFHTTGLLNSGLFPELVFVLCDKYAFLKLFKALKSRSFSSLIGLLITPPYLSLLFMIVVCFFMYLFILYFV